MKVSKTKITLLTIAFFFIGFITYYPIEKNIDALIRNNLNQMKACPTQYKSLELSWFLPSVIIKDLNIHKDCLGKATKDLNFSHVTISSRGLSFSPFGPHFVAKTSIEGNDLTIYITMGMGVAHVSIQDQKISSKLINSFSPYKIDGDLTINSLISAGSAGLESLDLAISSKNFNLPSQNIMGFITPKLGIKDLLLKTKQKGKNILEVEEFILGHLDADIRSRFTGSISLNKTRPSLSKMNLKGELFIAPAILDGDLALLKMALGQFDQKDNFYQIALSGSFAKPRAK